MMMRVELKLMIAAVLDCLLRDAVERGQACEPIFARLGAESLELAARFHINSGGTDAAFLGMAQDLLTVVRAGASEQ